MPSWSRNSCIESLLHNQDELRRTWRYALEEHDPIPFHSDDRWSADNFAKEKSIGKRLYQDQIDQEPCTKATPNMQWHI